jgi:hypothetical protein
MEWVYFAIVVGLVILGVVYRNRLKSFFLRIKAGEVSGELRGEIEQPINNQPYQPSSSVLNAPPAINFSNNVLDGVDNWELEGSGLDVDQNQTKNETNVLISGEEIKFSNNEMLGDKTTIKLRSNNEERRSAPNTELNPSEAPQLEDATAQAALPSATELVMEAEILTQPDLEQR